MLGKTLRTVKAQAGRIKANGVEVYTTLLIVAGLPFIAYIYAGWKPAVTVTIIVQTALGMVSLRGAK